MAVKDRKKRRLVRLGVIRLGHKETRKRKDGSEYSYPVQDDHFVLTDAPEIAAVYGNEPRELEVLLPFPDIVRNFDAFYQVWASGVLLCQGDGEYVQYASPVKVIDDKGKARLRTGEGETLITNGVARVAFDWNGEHFEAGEYVPCPGADANAYPHCQFCKLSCLLKVMMARPELFRMGYYQISTGSGRNYDTIMGTLEAMPADRLNGIPFKLRLVEEPTTYTENGKRHSTKKWFLQLEPDPEYTRELYARAAARQIGQDVVEEIPQLEAGQDNSVADEYVIEEPEYIQSGDVTVEDDAPFDGVDEPGAVLESWAQLKEQAVERLGYKHAKHVTNALKAIFNGNSESLTYDVAWTALVEYQESKNAG